MRKDNYHITIKNLTTWREEGFMLASGDTPYQIQGIDNVAQRVADGEILYSDFTNSRVFAQSDWDGGISKYWWPEKTYSVIYPSKKYKDKKNIEIHTWEFTLGGNVSEKFTIPFSTGEWPMCKGETAWVVYLWSWMKLYRSIDFWDTWSIFKDFSTESQLSDVNEITDITITDTKWAWPWPHPAPMWSISIWNIQCLFVAFYNRTTKASGIARYDFNFTVRSASGSTFKSWWSLSFNWCYWSKRDSITIDTNSINTWSVAAVYYEYSSWWWLTSAPSPDYYLAVSTWSWTYSYTYRKMMLSSGTWITNWLYIGQRFRALRTNTWVYYNCTVSAVWWLSNGIIEFLAIWLPWFDSSVSANNNYVIDNIGKIDSKISLAISWWIESYINIWFWLWQNIMYNWIRYNISWLWNWLDKYGDIPMYTCGINSWNIEYITLTRIDWWNAWNGIYWNWTQIINTEKWVYKYGTYNNKITKFITFKKELTHIWGYNHIDPENKLYDIAYWELWTNASYSNIYANSLNGIIHSVQNHTITFNWWDYPLSWVWVWYAEWATAWWTVATMYVGTQFWPGVGWTEAKLFEFSLKDDVQTAPTFLLKGTWWCIWMTAMTYFASKLYIGSKDKGMVYEWDNANSKFIELAQLPRDETTNQSVIDQMTTFAGKIICSYQKGSGVYTLDPNTRTNDTDPNTPLIETDVLCSVDTLSNARIYRICNTGWQLLFTNGIKIYSYNQDRIADQWYLESSIYGGYISNVDKQWVYGYVRVGKWELDDWQRVALQVSLDEWLTWKYCPTTQGLTFSDTNDWLDDNYSIAHHNTRSTQQLLFYFPYYTLSWTIIYRCWLKKGTTVKPVVNHIGLHYYLNYKQELLFNYQLDLNKSVELLGGRTVEKDLHFDKLQFLKDIWNNQYQVEVTDVTGIKYVCVPYSDDRTPWQGLIISTSNSNTGHIDLHNLTYRVSFSLKTIANYQKIL